VGGLSALIVAAGLAVFRREFARIGAQALADESSANALVIDAASRRAAVLGRRRWEGAGLQDSVALLSRIADGAADPADPAVRAACASEERYLRQLTLLSPELSYLGYWLARALAEARDLGVELVLRCGDVDAPDESVAAFWGELVRQAIAASPVGGDVIVGVFITGDGPCVTIMGRRLADVWASGAADREGWASEWDVLEDRYVVAIRPAA